jgi:regulatory protein YycI of two-component signal transduction system YycFG
MNINLKRTSFIVVILVIIILLTVFYLRNTKALEFIRIINMPSSTPSLLREEPSAENNVRCTADVKKCPDGSYVGRVPPSCSFVQCPGDGKY